MRTVAATGVMSNDQPVLIDFDDFDPSPEYLRKSYLLAVIGSFFLSAFFGPMSFFFLRSVSPMVAEAFPSLSFFVGLEWVAVLLFLGLLLGLSLLWARLTFNALHYQMGGSEIVVKSGVIFKRDVTIPFRTITNMDVILGPVDRIFGLATLHLQTAGSVNILAEGRLVGLLQPDAERLRDLLKGKLKGIQGGDATSMDGAGTEDPVERVLVELREIKDVLRDIRDARSD